MSQVSRAYFWVRQADQKMGPPICIFLGLLGAGVWDFSSEFS